jgi:serine acetyltransferase
MADIGMSTTIAAGLVVVRPVAAQVAVGNPTRVVKELSLQLRADGVMKWIYLKSQK